MQILSFDTSTPALHVALLKNGQIVASKTELPADTSRQESASRLIPTIDLLLQEQGWSKRDLDLIVVGVGPGSFTGVRVSVITARSLGQALQIGVFPVSSLEIVARRLQRPVAIISPAGAGQYFAAAYDENLHAAPLVEPFCARVDEVNSRLEAVKHRALSSAADDALFLANGNSKLAYPEIPNLAEDAGMLALERMAINKCADDRKWLSDEYPWDNVLPLYLRGPSVTLKAGNGSTDQTAGRS